MCFEGNKVCGLDVKNGLCSLKIEHANTEDLHDYFYEMVPHSNNPNLQQKCGYKLKDLANRYFENCNFQVGHHCAIADARMTRDLFKIKERLVKNQPVLQDKIPRSPREKFVFNKNNICKCKK